MELPTILHGCIVPGSKVTAIDLGCCMTNYVHIQVLDLYAGSASLGLACASLGLMYYGVEQNHTVAEAAEIRIGNYLTYKVNL